MFGSSTANRDSFQVTTPSEQRCLGQSYSVPVCEIDLRPGGKWRFVNRHPKGEAAFPDTVSVVTALLTEEGREKTRLTVTVRCPSMQVRDIVMGTGMSQGAGISYDRLEDLLMELQRS
jgi:uncharacterized protein YndB with AHSA1/START domain